MNKRPGHVVVTTEVAMCSFCGRPRTLRNEQHQLGALVRTIVTCETCHRTLSSSMTVASTEPEAAQPTAQNAAMESELVPETAGASPPAETQLEKAATKPAAQRKTTTAATKATAAKSRTHKKTR